MGVFFALLFVVCYLAIFVEWSEFASAFRQGGWACIAIYAVLTVLIVVILSTPETASVAPAAHAPVHH